MLKYENQQTNMSSVELLWWLKKSNFHMKEKRILIGRSQRISNTHKTKNKETY